MLQQHYTRPRDEATERIECYILQHHLAPHAKLPGERTLCEMWDMNRTTLRTAIRRLIVEGKLYNHKGSGTFIAPPKLERTLQDTKSFTELILNSACRPQTIPLDMGIVTCSPSVAAKLGIEPGNEVFYLRRLRKINGEPVSIEITYLDKRLCPDIESFDFSNESLYSVLARCGVFIDHGHESLNITRATEEESEILNIAPDTPLFFLSGISYDSNGQAIELFKQVIRADKIRFSSILTKKER